MARRKVMSAWLWAWLAEAELLVAEGAVAAGAALEPEPHPARTAPTVRVAIPAAILVAMV
ncbi:MAG TPA: hypothetical protein VK735_47910 [Pseudonocardia sp.]|uniref:hypothetical protein n=1 Tax=Pseudonocardia sp. TaxID=60912 RepID=UPI002BF259EE|nr:hypothetical protein [Pseudonocardia sp.]HTF55220.1 hypothetical protein [Pseudonocardia sp.]